MRFYCKKLSKKVKKEDLNCKTCDVSYCTVKNAIIPLYKHNSNNITMEDIARKAGIKL